MGPALTQRSELIAMTLPNLDQGQQNMFSNPRSFIRGSLQKSCVPLCLKKKSGGTKMTSVNTLGNLLNRLGYRLFCGYKKPIH